jgi:UDP-glucose 4-epimerase
MLSNKKVLVTGGCGFIGSELVQSLLKLNNKVTVIDTKKNIFFSDVNFIRKDLTNFEKILPHFEDIEIVFHLAADISIKYCTENPNTSLYNNIIATNNVLESCKLKKVKRLVFSSTAAVYKQKNKQTSYKETDCLNPLNPYSLSKQYGESLCKMYSNLYNVETIILRYFNVFGNNKIYSHYSSVINNFLYAKKNKQPLLINGTGSQTRDFIHVNDVVQANLKAANIKLTNYGEIFNIGSGTSISILSLAKKITNNINFLPKNKKELQHSKANILKAKQMLNWKPKEKVLDWVLTQI